MNPQVAVSRQRSAISGELAIRYSPFAILACAAMLLLATPAAYAGEPGAIGDLYVTKGTYSSVGQFDGTTGEPVGSFATGGGLVTASGLAFAPNGNLFVCCEFNDVVIEYDGATGQPVGVFAEGGGLNFPRGLTFGPNGNLFVASTLSSAILEYDWSTGVFVGVFASSGGPDYPNDLAFGPSGNLFVSTNNPREVLEYDGTTGALIGTFASVAGWGTPKGLAFAPNGNLFVVASNGYYDGRVLEYDGGTGELLRVFGEAPPLDYPMGLTFGPNGNVFVATSCCDLTKGVIEYDGASGALLGLFADTHDARFPAFKPAIGSFPQPQITGFSPPQALHCGLLTGATVTGTGLAPWVTVALTKAGEADIVGTVTAMTPDTSMTVDLDVIGAALGLWDLALTYPDDHTDTLIDAIEIVGCSPPDVTGLDPNQADNCAPQYGATVTGDDFMPGSTVRLLRAGEPDIVGLVTDEDPPTSITVDFFDTFGAAPGLWDLVVTLPGGGEVGSHTLTDALEITVCPPPEVTGIDPAVEDNCGRILTEATITGGHFLPSATVRLTRAGEPDRVGTVLELTPDPAATIAATFDLGDAAEGLWDVAVDVDGQVATLAGVLEVVACPPPEVTYCSLTHSYTCGPRWFRVMGAGFDDDVTIKLVKAGEADITATGLTREPEAPEPSWFTGTFDLSQGTAGGLWSLEFTNLDDGQSHTLPDVLEVDPSCPRGAPGDLYVVSGRNRNIIQFNPWTGEPVCIFVDMETVFGPSSDGTPKDLVWAPNGHLWVSTAPGEEAPGAVVEFDGNTGDFIRFIVPPASQNMSATSMSFRAIDGDLLVLSFIGDNTVQQYAFPNWDFVGTVLEPEPPMHNPRVGRFGSNGNFLLTGVAPSTASVSFREYDGVSFQLLQEVVDGADKQDFVEAPDGASYVVAEPYVHGETNHGRITKYDINTLAFVEVLIPPSDCIENGGCAQPPNQDPCCYEAMSLPHDLAYGPNGNLFVVANKTAVPRPDDTQGFFEYGAVHEFDPATGEQIRLIGRQDFIFYSVSRPYVDPGMLAWPQRLEFKPMPGDYTSVGGAFKGDWVVDENDFAHFSNAFSGPGNLQVNPHYRLSFDFDRDNDIDLADFAAFQRAFGTSMQTGTGACCLPDGTCLDDVWAPQCGGFYQGDGTVCGETPCPAFGACCDGEFDGTCRDLTESQCLALGDSYQGDYTECATTDCPYGIYSNEIDPMTSVALAGTGLQLADDMTLEGTGARDLTYLDLRVYGGNNGGGAFDVTIELWTDCPGDGGTLIPDTTFNWVGVPDDGYVYTLVVDPADPSVTIPDTVWMVATFSTASAGWIIAEDAETGTTENRYGWGNPWNCNATFGANYAGLWANLRCVEGEAKRSTGGESRLSIEQVPTPLSIEAVGAGN